MKQWGAFWLLGLIWGSSFLWIRIAVQAIGPVTLVSFRLLFGVLGLALVVLWKRPSLPRDRLTWGLLALLGIVNTAIPFVLISWGEERIPSALAAVLNGTTPLFTIVIAHLFLPDDRITVARAAGLAVGFAGVIVLLSRDLGAATLRASWLAQGAVLLAAVFYAGSAVFARSHFRGVSPIVHAFLPLVAADAAVWLLLPVVEAPVRLPTLPITWLALAWLGLLGSCLAYLLYYYLIHAWGPTRATVVTYVFPVVGLVLGILFLHETADWRLLGGSALIVGSIGLINLRGKIALRRSP
ncbi:MAG: DMT family transporter [Anaerolineales bacterium]